MKLLKKNLSIIIAFSIIGILIGSLSWEILERIINMISGNNNFTISIKNPIQLLDIYILSISFRANPGSLIGFICSLIIMGKI